MHRGHTQVTVGFETLTDESVEQGDFDDTGWIHPTTEAQRSLRKGGKRSRRHAHQDTHPMATHYANPDETTFLGATYTFRFGAYGDTTVIVFQRPDHVEDALETAAEWLRENEPGHFVEPDYEAAKDEIMGETGAGDDMISDEAIAELAEADLTHTESGFLASWEWTVDESDSEPFDAPRFDRFDVCEAHAAYWSQWHQGQWSAGYAALCRAQRLVSGDVKRFDALSENAQSIYRQLVLSDGR